jgi:hypothetical protein
MKGHSPTTQRAAMKTGKNLKRPTKSSWPACEVLEVKGDAPTSRAGAK